MRGTGKGKNNTAARAISATWGKETNTDRETAEREKRNPRGTAKSDRKGQAATNQKPYPKQEALGSIDFDASPSAVSSTA